MKNKNNISWRNFAAFCIHFEQIKHIYLILLLLVLNMSALFSPFCKISIADLKKNIYYLFITI